MKIQDVIQMQADRKNGVMICKSSIDALIEFAIEGDKALQVSLLEECKLLRLNSILMQQLEEAQALLSKKPRV